MENKKQKPYYEEWKKVQQRLVASVLRMELDATANQSILAHKHNRIAAQPLPDVLHLVRSHVVGRHDQNLGVLIEQTAQLLIVLHLLLRLGKLDCHC